MAGENDDGRITTLGTWSHAPFPIYDVPEDEELLAAVGTVALRHSHLDHSLKFTIKALARVAAQVALDALEYESSSSLRDRIRKLGRKAFGDGAALLELQAIMRRCKDATDQRNDMLHSIWCRDMRDTEVRGIYSGKVLRPLPTVPELLALAETLAGLRKALDDARQAGGFIDEALKAGSQKLGA